MPNNNKSPKTFLQEVAPWIRGHQLSVYVRGREKPLTGVTVCAVQPGVLIGRWNSSTHLIPLEAITYIRFAPDCDPCRDPTHPLHDTVQSHRPQGSHWQPPAKPYFGPIGEAPAVRDIVDAMNLPAGKGK